MHATARKYSIEGRIEARPQSKHILILGGLSQSLTNFRGPLIKAAIAAGHRVTAVGGDYNLEVGAVLKSWGAEFVHVPLARAGMDPIADLKTIWSLVALLRRAKPDIFLGYTIKPAAYGTLAAWIAGVPKRVAMVEGLGYAFTDGPEIRRRVARFAASVMYKIPARLAHGVIVLNQDDRLFFARNFMRGREQRLHTLPGIGVDLAEFSPKTLPLGPITFLMIARLLRDKGVYEYVEAARAVKKQLPGARFVLVGPFDSNPGAVQEFEVEQWVREGLIEYKGAVRDVRPYIAECHVYVLPSYREGMPRTVMEAMAMRRAVITTNAPGCRQTVIENETGLLVRARDTSSLIDACMRLAANRELVESMANDGRSFAKIYFDASVIALATLDLMQL